jgi:hypothetical protein
LETGSSKHANPFAFYFQSKAQAFLFIKWIAHSLDLKMRRRVTTSVGVMIRKKNKKTIPNDNPDVKGHIDWPGGLQPQQRLENDTQDNAPCPLF